MTVVGLDQRRAAFDVFDCAREALDEDLVAAAAGRFWRIFLKAKPIATEPTPREANTPPGLTVGKVIAAANRKARNTTPRGRGCRACCRGRGDRGQARHGGCASHHPRGESRDGKEDYRSDQVRYQRQELGGNAIELAGYRRERCHSDFDR